MTNLNIFSQTSMPYQFETFFFLFIIKFKNTTWKDTHTHIEGASGKLNSYHLYSNVKQRVNKAHQNEHVNAGAIKKLII